jgi:anti-sigma-K factor RskA
LRARVLAAVHGARQGGVVITLRTRLFATAAAFLLVVGAALGVTLANHEPIAVATVLGAGDATLAQQDVPGGRVTVVVSRAADRMALLAHLPPAPPGRTYQAWTVDGRYHSAGLMPDGDAAMTIDHVATVAVTVEPDGGSPRPTTKPVATISLP